VFKEFDKNGVDIVGYRPDSIGPFELNQNLSNRRAQNVAARALICARFASVIILWRGPESTDCQ
jgi:hypothetical protein